MILTVKLPGPQRAHRFGHAPGMVRHVYAAGLRPDIMRTRCATPVAIVAALFKSTTSRKDVKLVTVSVDKTKAVGRVIRKRCATLAQSFCH